MKLTAQKAIDLTIEVFELMRGGASHEGASEEVHEKYGIAKGRDCFLCEYDDEHGDECAACPCMKVAGVQCMKLRPGYFRFDPEMGLSALAAIREYYPRRV